MTSHSFHHPHHRHANFREESYYSSHDNHGKYQAEDTCTYASGHHNLINHRPNHAAEFREKEYYSYASKPERHHHQYYGEPVVTCTETETVYGHHRPGHGKQFEDKVAYKFTETFKEEAEEEEDGCVMRKHGGFSRVNW